MLYKFKLTVNPSSSNVYIPFFPYFQFIVDSLFRINIRLFFFMEDKGFNVTQGMALLLLKPLNLPANYVLNLIIYITNPINNIGY